jgi:hypothetical protein
LPLQSAVNVDVPQLGQEVEQTTSFSDYRDVDGVKIPFQIKASSSVQSYTISIDKVKHNVAVDDALLVRPVKK